MILYSMCPHRFTVCTYERFSSSDRQDMVSTVFCTLLKKKKKKERCKLGQSFIF